jgi:hypothetical protein
VSSGRKNSADWHVNMLRPPCRLVWPSTRRHSTLVYGAQGRTIYALSTPLGKAGIGVIRISGPDSLEIWKRMVVLSRKKCKPQPWKLHKCQFVHPQRKQTLDSGLAVFFPSMPFVKCSKNPTKIDLQVRNRSQQKTYLNFIYILVVLLLLQF